MTNEEKIQELRNTYPVNSLGVNKDELCAYKQGVYCGAYNMAEWKDEKFSKVLTCIKISIESQGFCADKFIEEIKKQWEK